VKIMGWRMGKPWEKPWEKYGGEQKLNADKWWGWLIYHLSGDLSWCNYQKNGFTTF
jgi:hypothetical protein